MDLSIARLLVDFGLVVLIWLVQLCIYPAFTYFETNNLKKWHSTYTGRITLVVLPLMLSQLLLSLYQFYEEVSTFTITYLVLVGLSWLVTFLVYVPLHQKIDTHDHRLDYSKKLVALNWWRVVLWMFIFLISLYKFLE